MIKIQIDDGEILEFSKSIEAAAHLVKVSPLEEVNDFRLFSIGRILRQMTGNQPEIRRAERSQN